jgi:hypothetical protein
VEPELAALLAEVEQFAKTFPAVGFDEDAMMHK